MPLLFTNKIMLGSTVVIPATSASLWDMEWSGSNVFGGVFTSSEFITDTAVAIYDPNLWPGSGSQLEDITGNGNLLSASLAVADDNTFFKPYYGGVMYSSGSATLGDYVGYGYNKNTIQTFLSNSFSITADIYMSGSSPDRDTTFIGLGSDNEPSAGGLLNLVQIQNSNKIGADYAGGSGPGDLISASLSVDTWYSIGYVRTPSEHFLYVDGVLQSSGSLTTEQISVQPSQSIQILARDGGNPMPDPNAAAYGFVGKVAYYSSSLSQEDINANYLSTKNRYS